MVRGGSSPLGRTWKAAQCRALLRRASVATTGCSDAATRLFGRRVVALGGRHCGTLSLPGPWKRAKGGNVARPVIRLIVVPRRPDLVRHRPAEHMKDFVPLVPRVTKPHRRLPDLGRIPVPQLGRHDIETLAADFKTFVQDTNYELAL